MTSRRSSATSAAPEMLQRRRTGLARLVLFLIFLTGLTYALKRKVWSSVH